MTFYAIVIVSAILMTVIGFILLAKTQLRDLYQFLIVAGVFGVIISVFTICTYAATSYDMAENIVEEHAVLETYYEIVDKSYNEYVRYDYKERVDEFNTAIDNYYKYSENFFMAPFYTLDKIGYAKPIYFELRHEGIPEHEKEIVSVG